MFGCSHVSVHSLLSCLQQVGISSDEQDRRDVKKQRQDAQDKTVKLHSRIDVSGSSQQL